MDKDEYLTREWVEIVLVLEDGILIDSSYDMHVFNGPPGSRAPGFYLAVHAGGRRDFGRAELVGPFEQRGMVEMLHESALHLGAADCALSAGPRVAAAGDVAVGLMPAASVLPLIRREAAVQLARLA